MRINQNKRLFIMTNTGFDLTICLKAVLIISIMINNYHSTSAHKILLIGSSVKSHSILFVQLGLGLSEHGHDVTLVQVSTFTMPVELEKDRITIETYNASLFDENPDVQRVILQQLSNPSIGNSIDFGITIVAALDNEAWSMFHDKLLMQKLAEAKFDFAVISPPLIQPYTYVVHKLGIPFAYMGVECVVTQMSLPSMNPSYVPNGLFAGWLSDDMNIFQKTVNTMAYIAVLIRMSLTASAEQVQRIVPNRPPVSFSDIQRNASICLRVRESILDTPRPNLPNVIDIGSLLIREKEGLPLHVQQFLDNSPDGAIFVSFGSVVDQLPDYTLLRIAEAFKKIKYNIIWKSQLSSKLNLSENKLLVLRWAPQIDILAHPNTKCFVSHCGYSSTLESIYYGVPIVGLPVFGDQPGNAKLMEHKGYGKRLDMALFTADELAAAIEEVITGPYSNNVHKASAILRDLPPGKDRAVFWIEHVIKHGGDHLRSRAIQMPLWEYLMLDVAAVAVVVIVVLWLACRSCCGRMYRYCHTRNPLNKATKLD